MPRTNRLFALIQALRAAPAPVTAAALAREMEVSSRTIYRDIVALQAQRVPVEGAAGLGYVLRRGYDLPPLNFDAEEADALQVGMAMLARSGDLALQRAARRIAAKIEALQHPPDWLQVAPWGAPEDDPALGCVPVGLLRQAIRDEQKLRLRYRSPQGEETDRVIRPIAVIYHVNCTMLAGWCELRAGFRHFRTDRIWEAQLTGADFKGQGAALRQLWQDSEKLEETWSGRGDLAATGAAA